MISGENSRINGLVLAGGKSVRMGSDKGLATWHGKAQRYYMADMLAPLCAEVFISCREEQAGEIDPFYKTIVDAPAYAGSGPSGAILTAFETYPNTSWLVVACDLPLLDPATLKYLLQNRDGGKVATTFRSPYDGLPEPLITIWEPAAYTILLTKLQEGFKCPRKVLINSDTAILDVPDPVALSNTNTPGEAEQIWQILRQSTSHAT